MTPSEAFEADQKKFKKTPGVEYDVNKRWESGTSHHPKSLVLFKRIAEIDFLWTGDLFCWKSGGDGDNGESLMYLLDIVFEEQDLCSKNSNVNEVDVP